MKDVLPVFRNPFKDPRFFAWTHFLLCAPGLFGLSELFSSILYRRRFGGSRLFLNEWIRFYYYPQKPFSLIFYVLSVATLFSYFGAMHLWMRRREDPFPEFRGWAVGWPVFGALYVAITGGVAVNVFWRSLGAPVQEGGFFLRVAMWLAALSAPFLPEVWKRRDSLDRAVSGEGWRRARRFFLAVVLVQFASIFVPFIRGPLKMINEYMDIPEKTVMNGVYVDNARYMNGRGIGGVVRYDPDLDKGDSPAPISGSSIGIPWTPGLETFISRNQSGYYYDRKRQSLVVSGRTMTLDEREELVGAGGTSCPEAKISDLFYGVKALSEAVAGKQYSSEELEFVEKNHVELNWQILNRWVIHHHNFILGPVNEYSLGKPLREINFQYGFLNVVMMKCLMEKLGGITYQNYFRIWYSFWPVYYAMFFLTAFLVLEDLSLVLILALLSCSFVNMIGHQFLFLGVGLNPIRRLFDMAVLAMLHVYLKKDRPVFLWGGILFSLASIANNKEYGVFLLGALVVSLAFRWASEGKIRRDELIRLGVGLASAFLLLLILGGIGVNVQGHYYLRGVLGFDLPRLKFLSVLGFVFFSTFLLMVLFRKAGVFKYVVLFLLVYSSEALLYYVWGSTNPHFFNVGALAAITAVALLKLVLDESPASRWASLVTSTLTISLLGLYIPSLYFFYSSMREYGAVFKTHKTYEWNMQRAHFLSTMDPAYFQEAVELIRKYEPGNKIYMVSKYDNFIPFLAGKYSGLPFFDVSYFLFTQKEIDMCVDAIREAKPPELFVDADIERNLNGEIVPENEPIFGAGFHGESLVRVERLYEQRKIFQAVKADYEPVEKGRLIAVYRRRKPLPVDVAIKSFYQG